MDERGVEGGGMKKGKLRGGREWREEMNLQSVGDRLRKRQRRRWAPERAGA